MKAHLTSAFGETVRDPKKGLARVLSWGLDRTIWWMIALLVVVFSTFLNMALVFVSPQLLDGPQMIPNAPFLQVLVFGGALVLTVFGTHYIGRIFGGQGVFENALAAVVWLQGVLLIFQVLQLVLIVFSAGLAGLYSIGLFVLTIWLFVNFVASVHGFKSLWKVLIGCVASSFGVGIGLVLIFSFLAVLMGLDIPNV